MKLCGFDVETSGVDIGYGLQPFRVRTGEAWLTSVAIASHDKTVGRLHPTTTWLRRWLKGMAHTGTRIVGWNTPFDMAWLIALGLREEVYNCEWLDAMLLWRHLTASPEWTGKAPASYGLKSAVKSYYSHEGNYDDGIDFNADTPEEMARLLEYNKKDAKFTRNLALFFWERLTERQRANALIEAACLPLVAEAHVEGIVANRDAAETLALKLEDVGKLALVNLAFHPKGNGPVPEDVLRSPAKLRKLLYQDWGLPIVKVTSKGAESTDRDALATLAATDDRAALLNEYRESVGNRTKFALGTVESLDYNGDGRVRPNARVYSTYCVPGDVEVLTRKGWVALQSWDGGDIAQVREDQTIEFLRATKFVGPMTQEWVRVKHDRLACDFTPGHTVPYLSQKYRKWCTMKAGELSGGGTRDLPVAGVAKLAGRYTPEQMRVFAMVQADGYFSPKNRLELAFKKERKKVRARELLQASGITFHEYVCAKYPDRTEFHIGKRSLPDWLTPQHKVFGPWLLDTTQEGLAAFVEETVHWDGSPHQDGGHRYASSIESNVTWVVTAAALVGRKASQHAPYQGMHCCHISPANIRPVATVRPSRHVTRVQEWKQAFCAQTQTGFWLARSKGTIFVSGNTGRMIYSSKILKNKDERPVGVALHQWKRDQEFRDLIRAPDGYTLLEFDFAGQEYRWMAVMSKDKTMLELCQPGEDAHAYMGSKIGMQSLWAGRNYLQLKQAVHQPQHEHYATAKRLRQLGKVANLSLQYRTSANRLRQVARVQHGLTLTQPEATAIHATYRVTYPGVPDYWKRQIRKARLNGWVETIAGRRVWVGREGDWERLKVKEVGNNVIEELVNNKWNAESTAINFPIQGAGADQKYLALKVAKDYLPEVSGKWYYELHDGLFFIVPHHRAEKALHDLKRLLSNLPYASAWDVNLPISFPVDAKFGKTWGTLKECLT